MSIIHIRGLFDDYHNMLKEEAGPFLPVSEIPPGQLASYWSKRTIYEMIKALKENKSNDRLREHLHGKGIDLEEVLSHCDVILEWRRKGNNLAHPTVVSYLNIIAKLHDENLKTECLRIIESLEVTPRL